MPILAWLKRREACGSNNAALCGCGPIGYLFIVACITLVGLAVNATFHIAWFDSAAAVATLPLLLTEAKRVGVVIVVFGCST
jgi:hypothetical protein